VITTPVATEDATRESPVKLLWTAGWDSTYRLLELVLMHKKSVQPYYFLLERHSGAMERERMEQIKERLFQAYPAAQRLVMDTIFVPLGDVPPDIDALHAMRRLRAAGGARPLGGQYYHFAAAAKHLDLCDLELGLHAEEGPIWYEQLCANVHDVDGGCRLIREPRPAELEVLRRFTFPILKLTKTDMAMRAREAGFESLLELTWFCHKPDRKGRACGLCSPCRLTMEQGLARRIPRINRVRRAVLWPLTSILSHYRVRHRARNLWKRLRSRANGSSAGGIVS
jgi:hypothetical protein